LSIDRICNGLSNHPDPSAVCQTAVNVKVLHQIIAQARSGKLPVPGNRSFRKVIIVGHSYGSLIVNFLQATYPADADAGILTGWADYVNVTNLDPIFEPALAPAYIVSPTEYGNLSPYYLEFDNITAFQLLFYHAGNYDPDLFSLDFSLRGTGTYGERK
jgi:pimeloyl-ACP methyl ester carboxylesterase